LTGKIIEEYFASAFIVGNIGNPYTEAVLNMQFDTVTVAEISSFQLETTKEFHPQVSAILNITPDHLDRHHTMENYVRTKQEITKNQTKEDVCVLNYEDPILREEAKKIKNKVLFFSSRNKLEYGIYLQDGNIVFAEHGKVTPVCSVHDMKLVGLHNVENVMAAIGMALTMQVPIEVIRKAVAEFNAVEHRIEYVATKQGVIYYNDSKGTNTDASIKAIEAMTRPTVVIAGGYDKGSEFDDWFDSFNGKVKHLLLIGATRDKIAKTAISHKFDNYTFVESMEEAVKTAAAITKDGDAVLLSPACASWDMFKSYEERGTLFKEYVKQL
jgi:UDP-N-acetylmuramoylalanine--D-glutamate ligase